MSEAVTKTIVGTCEEIEQKPGSEWVKFKINVGSKYPVGLSTKVEKIIEEARAVGSEIATWTFKERESDQLNENTGKPFVNRYLDKVEIGGDRIPEPGGLPSATSNTGSTPAPQRPQAGAHQPVAVGDKDRAITRMACLKAAADIYQGHGAAVRGEATDDAPVWQDEAVTLTLAAAARFEIWVYRDIDEVPF